MKLNLALHELIPLADYINISPNAKLDDPKWVKGDITQLDIYADDGELEELRLLNVLEYYSYNEIDNLLNQWIRKLRRGGVLTISSPELVLICKAIANRDIDMSKAQELLYGTKRCGLSSLQLVEILKLKNMKILTNRLNNFNFIIQGIRQ